MNYFISVLVACVFLLFPTLTKAIVYVDTIKGIASDFDKKKTKHKIIKKSILDGTWDSSELDFPINLENKSTQGFEAAIVDKRYVRVSSKTFLLLPKLLQTKIVRNLSSWDDNLTAYKVMVKTKNNDLQNMEVIKRLRINLNSLPENVGAEKLLSEYARRWAYNVSDSDGPNCLHTSLAAIFSRWTEPMYLDQPDFLFYRNGVFKVIPEPTQWGDMIYFDLGRDYHAFNFLGLDLKDPSKKIVFSKNGYERGHFLFMDLEDVKALYAPIAKITYHRAKGTPPPPTNDEGDFGPRKLEKSFISLESFPVIKAGLRTKPARSFAPIEF
ncbi:MAG: hypothetical protein SGI74_11050 [Oligoflexia bacterium]|nr:hypothetical protein [Oligoflexia bacterium]